MDTSNYDTAKINERYFRPSKLPALNIRNFDYSFYDKYSNPDYTKIILPDYLFTSPENSILNYFSILREAESISKGGCGSIGDGKTPYPISYNFFTKEYQNTLPYSEYLKAFNDIGHINLVKLNNVTDPSTPKDTYKYFFEIETIEPSTNGNTSFAYYYGFMYLKNDNGKYKISDIDIRGEDFLCAAYHGWSHDAESYVSVTYGDWCKLIKTMHPIEQKGYVKNVYFTGTDGKEYKIEFFQLTNGNDVQVGQFIKDSSGNWKPVTIDVYKCLNNQPLNRVSHFSCPFLTIYQNRRGY